MTVKVLGFIPDPEVGEVPFDSAVYDITYDKDDHPQFLIWNPYLNAWQIVDASLCRALNVPAQDLNTKTKMKRLEELRAQRKQQKQ